MKNNYRFRLRDKHCSGLNRQARAVNIVWNYANETQQKAVKNNRRWLSAFDLQKLTAGSSKELGLHAHTIQRVGAQYVESRKQHKKPWLRFSGRKSLGWVPFNTGHVQFNGENFKFNGKIYEPMHLRDLPTGVKIGAGSFSQDARGIWYINCPIEVAEADRAPIAKTGIDLGLKTTACLSGGHKIEAPQFYRKSEQALATSNRANKSKRLRAIHAKIANRRKDFLHKASNEITKNFGLIFVGDVSPNKLAQTRMAKSVYDAGWSSFKKMLLYKSIRNGGRMIEVNERMTSQTCSECGSIPPSRPRGIAGLGIREWRCDGCGQLHDRDINAARNILRIGLNTLAEGAAS